jgi:hypothetical protein
MMVVTGRYETSIRGTQQKISKKNIGGGGGGARVQGNLKQMAK